MKKTSVLFLALFVLLPVPVAGRTWTGELKLVKGKGVAVCEAHFKNLKQTRTPGWISSNPKEPQIDVMVCNRDEFYPEANGITRPKWEELDLRENKELVKRIEKFFSFGDQFIKDKMLDDDEKGFEAYVNKYLMRMRALHSTTVDIDNNGKTEKVMRYGYQICMESHAYSRPLFVLDESKDQIDVGKTEPLLQNPFPKHLRAKAVNHNYQLYDVLFYKSKAYFDKWNMRDRTFSVYNQSKGKVIEICKYKYKQTPKKQGGLKP